MGIIQHQHETQASSELKEIHLEEKLKSIRGVVSGVMGCILNICKKFAECVYGGVMGQAPAKQTNERRDNLATTSCSSDQDLFSKTVYLTRIKSFYCVKV